ncbi:YigZ family protein [Mahella sp.]|uniref:YigZ family protein n=1 Tax=Mahella sp. TaxID=2798721 RepID=UPI0025C14FA6|nr:YigZ family protein [Mahella sp.]MBZ4665700.1 Impact family protein [Mahella sp.]
MQGTYRTVKDYAREQYVVKRSKFIASLKPVLNEGEAVAFLADVRNEFYDATHNCYAYNILIDGSPLWRFSDDGEPSGTAGMPILNVIKQRSLSNVAIVVTRYFGGILLGAGGLVRAYSHAAALVVDAAGIMEMLPAKRICVITGYNLLISIQKLVSTFEAQIVGTDYEDKVKMYIIVKTEVMDRFIKSLHDISKGDIDIRIENDTYMHN